MTKARHAAVAGMFYPRDPGELGDTVRALLAGAAAQQPSNETLAVPKVLIAPHAGYAYSGPIAASAFARLETLAQPVRRVVLLGPSHHLAFRGIALAGAETFLTPLGAVAVDSAAEEAIRGFDWVFELEAAHSQEHSLEVELPFLQQALDGDFALVPLVVGDASAEEVAQVLDRLWGSEETLIVVSSDLSHFLDYETARRVDAETAELICSLASTSIEPARACGCRCINGLIVTAKRRSLEAELFDLRNSGDTSGDRRRVVGYGAWGLA
jgi:AmmeMemoRadiSam system protein B